MVQHADHDIPLVERVDMSVLWEDGEYRIGGGGAGVDTEFNLGTAVDTLIARMHHAALRPFATHTRIHAASGIGPDGMVLLVGDKRSGKTTLAAHLLLQGFEMLGDELVLLRGGQAVTFPRRFYLRPAALDLLPGLGSLAGGAPSAENDREGRMVAVDPPMLGRPWRIRPAPIAAVVFIEPNHTGTSRIATCPKLEMVRQVLAQCSPPASAGAGWVSDLCRTINRCTTVTAHLGDLPTATEALRRFLG